MTSEVILCPKCKHEKEYYYDSDETCVYATTCPCEIKAHKDKKLDQAFAKLAIDLMTGKFVVSKGNN